MALGQDDRATIATDETKSTLEMVKNCLNDRVYGPSKETDIDPNRLFYVSPQDFLKKSWSLPVSLVLCELSMPTSLNELTLVEPSARSVEFEFCSVCRTTAQW